MTGSETPTAPPAPRPLTREELADLLGVSSKTVTRAVCAGTLPPADIRISQRTLRWSPGLVARITSGRRGT